MRGVAADVEQPASSSDAVNATVSDETNTSENASAGLLGYQIRCKLHCLLQLFCSSTPCHCVKQEHNKTMSQNLATPLHALHLSTAVQTDKSL